jgi:hypothetical protein
MRQTGLKLWPGGSLVSGNIADNGAGGAGTNATGIVTSWSPSFPTSAASMVADTTSIDLTGYDAVFIRALLTGTSPVFDDLQLSIMFGLFDPMGIDENSDWFAPRIVYASTATNQSNQHTALTGFGTIPTGLLTLLSDFATAEATPTVYPSTEVGRTANLAVLGYSRQVVTKYQGTPLTHSSLLLPLAGATKMAYRVRVCRISGSSASVTGVGVRLLYCGVNFD